MDLIWRAGHIRHLSAERRDRKSGTALKFAMRALLSPMFIELLRKHQIGLVVADTVDWPLLMDVTADFVYCRLHGSEQLYASGYGATALDLWADRVVAWSRGEDVSNGRFACTEGCRKLPSRDVYVNFDNDMKVRAPFDAKNLSERVERRLLGR